LDFNLHFYTKWWSCLNLAIIKLTAKLWI
jgi:hypothetical protein